ncbi:hypothetical protein C8F04DRAFT_1272780 [Mycena alexandri]|uniref:Uncharacterized protein n=1 Tax=Mycena alexandri TaxID=1745969 RepID=A0AAD6S7W3_9AGAR|nr:hypothetical protein C8F04DRAFT_1272780 [Mycena alexandri]
MPFEKRRRDSDDEYIPPQPSRPPKRRRREPRNVVQIASSPAPILSSPAAEQHHYTPARPSTPEAGPSALLLPSLNAALGLPLLPVTSGTLETSPQRAPSTEPPTSSPISSVIDETPVKDRRGRPAFTPRTRQLTSTVRALHGNQSETPRREAYQEAAAQLAQRKADSAAARAQAGAAAAVQKAEEQALAREELDKKAGAETRTREAELTRSDSAKEDYISAELAAIYQQEGRVIQNLLTRNSTTKVTDLLREFSMEQLAADLEDAAPWLWRALVVISEPGKSTRAETAGETRKHKGLGTFLSRSPHRARLRFANIVVRLIVPD